MDKLVINFVLEFAKDLYILLDSLEKEFGNQIVNGTNYYKRKVRERALKLTKELYSKYKDSLDLKIDFIGDSGNIILINSNNDMIYVPKGYLESKKFFLLKERLEKNIRIMELGETDWNQFIIFLFNSFNFSNGKLNRLNLTTLEKIRFFMSFLNEFPSFDFTTIPEKYNNKNYEPMYKTWSRTRSYLKLYERYIRRDRYFFNHHISILPIPNYKIWNLKLVFIDKENLENLKQTKTLKYFPIQIFEDNYGSPISIIALIPEHKPKSFLNGSEIKSYQISNNFNIFNDKQNDGISITPYQEPIFESYVKYLDEKENGTQKIKYFKNTYNYCLDFRKKEENIELVNGMLNQNTIKEYNLQFHKELSSFQQEFLSDNALNNNPYRKMFHLRCSFPDFNFSDRFLLICEKKRRNTEFYNFVNFLKNWTYQTIFYELKDKLVFYGFLLPNFDHSKEIIIIDELFNRLNVDYSFLVNNNNLKISNLSLFSLPSSNQYIEENETWNLNEIKFPMTIREKEILISQQITEEMK